MRRYTYHLGLAITGLLMSVAVTAQDEARSVHEPYTSISPAVLAQYPETKMQIILFYSVTCPFCRQVHKDIVRWGASLPPEYELKEVHIVTHETIPAAKTIAAGLKVGGKALEHTIIQSAYQHIQSGHQRVDNPETWVTIVESIKAPQKPIWEAWGSLSVDQQIHESIELQSMMDITVTPTIVVAGRYRVDLDNANGKINTLILMLNGMVSAELRGETL